MPKKNFWAAMVSGLKRECPERDPGAFVSGCCGAEINYFSRGPGSMSGPSDPVAYCSLCDRRCRKIWLTVDEIRAMESGEKSFSDILNDSDLF